MEPRLIIPVLGILLVMIPVAGITLTLTIRLALTPLVEKLAKALRESGLGSSSETDLRVADLEEQIQVLVTEVRRLNEGRAFERQLLEHRSDPSD